MVLKGQNLLKSLQKIQVSGLDLLKMKKKMHLQLDKE